MPDERFTECLFRQLQRFDGEHQEILDAWKALTQEHGVIGRRIELLRQLLAMESPQVTGSEVGGENKKADVF